MIRTAVTTLAMMGGIAAGTPSHAKEVTVRGSAELNAALKSAKPGTVVLLAPGDYRGGVHLQGLSGTKDAPIVIAGRDESKPPTFTGGSQAIHLASCDHIVLRNLQLRGFPINGVNADDGGSKVRATGLVFETLTIENTGPKGNHDALKLSGLDGFVVRKCTFRGWGGSGIDMVGCHNGVVEDCRFFGADGFSQSSAIQMKGGSTRVLVHRSFFMNAGARAINLGGSTGLAYFRPEVADYEAKDITVAGNIFVGGETPVAFATSRNGIFRHNTIVKPGKWVLRILQEQEPPKFRPCGDHRFENNLILFDKRVRFFANVGRDTKPETFRFTKNAWYDLEGARKPDLPVAEAGGVYQPELKIEALGTEKMKIESDDPRMKEIGAGAYRSKQGGR